MSAMETCICATVCMRVERYSRYRMGRRCRFGRGRGRGRGRRRRSRLRGSGWCGGARSGGGVVGEARQRPHDLRGGEHANVRVRLQEPARRHRHVGRAHRSAPGSADDGRRRPRRGSRRDRPRRRRGRDCRRPGDDCARRRGGRARPAARLALAARTLSRLNT